MKPLTVHENHILEAGVYHKWILLLEISIIHGFDYRWWFSKISWFCFFKKETATAAATAAAATPTAAVAAAAATAAAVRAAVAAAVVVVVVGYCCFLKILLMAQCICVPHSNHAQYIFFLE